MFGDASSGLERKRLKFRAALVEELTMTTTITFGQIRQTLDLAAGAVDAASSLYAQDAQDGVAEELVRLAGSLRLIPASKLMRLGCAVDVRFQAAEQAVENARSLGIRQATEGITGNRRVGHFLAAAQRNWQLAQQQIRQLAGMQVERMRVTVSN